MRLKEFFSPDAISLHLAGTSKDEIPHCRSLVVSRLRVAFGRKPEGVDFRAIDEKPVYNFFLIVAPPLEVSNQYLPVLGKIAQFAKEPDVPDRLQKLAEPGEFMALLESKSF
jgi:mannitol/fructose-specific phosphotransferase system IIA component (Ntr-type)